MSGVDSYDARSAPNGPSKTSGLLENFVVMSQLDLFRYSAPGTLDWSTGGTKYLSLDGGLTQLFGNSLFSTGGYNGDGRQASHWKDSPANNPQLGIMDPTSGYGQMQEITALDLGAFDVIGWNVNFDVAAHQGYRFNTASAYNYYINAVPEPSTWASMVMGFGLLAFAMRRVRSRKVVYLA